MKQTREISHVDICWRERQTTNLRERQTSNTTTHKMQIHTITLLALNSNSLCDTRRLVQTTTNVEPFNMHI